MELVKTDYKIRCELGACKNFADSTVKLGRTGVRSRIHVCGDCLRELGALIGAKDFAECAQTTEKCKGRKKGSLGKSGKEEQEHDLSAENLIALGGGK